MFNLERVELFQVIKTPFRKNIDMQLLSLMLVAKLQQFYLTRETVNNKKCKIATNKQKQAIQLVHNSACILLPI